MTRVSSFNAARTECHGPGGSDWRDLFEQPFTTSLVALLVATLWLIASPTRAYGAEIRQGDTVLVPPGVTIDDDLYAFGTTVTIQGTVTGDVVAAGQSISVQGPVNGDVIATGQSVDVSGQVTGDLMVAGQSIDVRGPIGATARLTGQSIEISAPIAGDVLAGTAMLNIGPGGKVGRDLLAVGHTILVGGPVGRSIRAGAESLTIGGPVGGDVVAQTGALSLASGAAIEGALTYTSGQEAMVDDGATVGGLTTRVEPAVPSEPAPAERLGDGVLAWLQGLIGIAALGLVLVLLFPGFSRRAVETLKVSPWTSLGLGLAVLGGVPVAAVLLFVVGLLIGGWWLGPLVLALYAGLLPLGYVACGLYVGRLITTRLARQRGVALGWSLLAGLTLLGLLTLVPFIGGLVIVGALLFGLGALVRTVVATYSGQTGRAQPAIDSPSAPPDDSPPEPEGALTARQAG